MFSHILCAFVVILKEVQKPPLKEPLEATHGQQDGWGSTVNNDVTSMKQTALGHCEPRGAILF